MPDIGLPLNAGSLPYACYPSDPQTLYSDMFSRGSALASDLRGVIISESAPAAADQDKLWVQTTGGAPIRQFIYFNAQWVWPHASAAGGNERRLWVGTLAQLVTYDGGDSGALGDASGAMWAEDTDFAGRSPMHPGTITNAVPATTLGVNDNFGNGSELQTDQQVAPHTHPLSGDTTIQDGVRLNSVFSGVGGAGVQIGNTGPPATDIQVTANTYLTTQQRMSVVHPVRGIYIIRRTSRVYYRAI